MRRHLPRLFVAVAVATTSLAAATLGTAQPAAACTDWLAPDRLDAGFVAVRQYFRSFAVGRDGTLILGTSPPRTIDPDTGSGLSYENHWSWVGQTIPLDDGGALLNREGSAYRYRADGGLAPGFPVHLGAEEIWADGDGVFVTVTGTPTPGSTDLGTLHRHLADGSPDTGFGGDGRVDISLTRGSVDATASPTVLLMYPAVGGIDLLVSWLGDGPGSTLQYVNVAPDATVTVRGELTDPNIRLVDASAPLVSGDVLETLIVETDLAQPNLSAARMVAVDLTGGALVTYRFLPALPANLVRTPSMAGSGTTRLVSLGGAYSIVDLVGDDPLLASGGRGWWSELGQPGAREWDGVLGVGALPTGEYVLGLTAIHGLDAGIYVLRGTRQPDRYIRGGLSDQVDRLFRTALGRSPDAEGADHWRRQRASGATTVQLAAELLASQEFASRFGELDDLSDKDFIDRIFRNSLGRPSTGAERNSWLRYFWDGIVNRQQWMAYWADTISVAKHTDSRLPLPLEAELYRLYQAVFLRPPDLDGHCYWSHQQDDGLALDAIATWFVSSTEFQNRYGALDDAAFVDRLYLNVLGRPAEPEGLAYWVGQLAAGATRGQVVLAFSESPEFLMVTDTVPR